MPNRAFNGYGQHNTTDGADTLTNEPNKRCCSGFDFCRRDAHLVKDIFEKNISCIPYVNFFVPLSPQGSRFSIAGDDVYHLLFIHTRS